MIREGVMISGRYEIMGRVGNGGMADVYKAIDRKLNRYVAVKVLKREFREDESFVRKFQTEAQSAAVLTHPNIVNVYDVGEDRGLYYIVMELVEGITLKDYIQKKGRLTTKEVISIALQVCSGMEMAHNNNIIHRDIKPQNIMISKEGKVKVTDFGIAKATSSNTISTNVMGSVHYTSPEQARGGFSDAKSDIYSLGITMYEMITGELPFDGDSTVSIALKHLQEDIVPPSELVPDMPYSLERIILKCTQKSPDRRYVDIAQLSRDLKHSLADPDGDFVVIKPLTSVADTRMVSPEELERIQKAAEYSDDSYDEYDEYEDDDYEERRERRRRNAEKEKEIDPKMAKIMKILTIVVTVIFIFILIFVIGKATNLFGVGPGESTNIEEEEKVKVPKLVGLTEEEAKDACEEQGLVLKVAKRDYSTEYEEGLIYKQRTQADTKMPKGATVQVEVSSGILVEIPKLEDEDYIDARDELIELGFSKSKIKIEEEPHDTIKEEKVTRTEPEAGKKVAKDTEITIFVSTGIEMIRVPNLVGETKENAAAMLEELGLEGSVTEEYNNTVEAGKVISQKTDEGDEVAKGSTVEYVVSKGAEPKEQVKIPTGLKGKSFSSVKATLQNKGFVVQASYEPNDTYADGYVVHVEGEGLEVDKGSTVVVVVSTGSEPSDDSPGNNEQENSGNSDQNSNSTTP